MKERSDILLLYRTVLASAGQGVLATVVKTSGSTYRRPGARMLLTEDGRSAGLISGGCLERDLRERSLPVLATGEPALITYDTTSHADIIWGLGLGCTGIAHILLERVGAGRKHETLEFIGDCTQRRTGGVIATVYSAPSGAPAERGSSAYLREGLWTARALDDSAILAAIHEAAATALSAERTTHLRIPHRESTLEVLIEYVAPTTALTIFGAGPDAVPLVRMAKELGWHVTVVDGRSEFLTRASFPDADELRLVHPEESAETIDIRRGGCAVVMTHNFNHDAAILKAVLASPARYIGLLGPRSKAALLLDRLAEDGIVPTENDLARLHIPIGLDIGADTPEEIALAILAEIQAAQTHRPGSPLRHREGPIHR